MERARPTRCRTNALGTHHLLEALCPPRPACRVLVTGTRRRSTGPATERSTRGAARPIESLRIQQARAGAGRATRACDDAGSRSSSARPFNHIGPRQSRDYFAVELRPPDRRIAAGDAPPVIRVGNLTARRDLTDVRDMVAAYEPDEKGAAAGDLQRLLRAAPGRFARSSTGSSRSRASTSRSSVDPDAPAAGRSYPLRATGTAARKLDPSASSVWAPTIPAGADARPTLLA